MPTVLKVTLLLPNHIILTNNFGAVMNAHRIEKTRIASKAIIQSQFMDTPQMMRWRRLVEKYSHTALILNGTKDDFVNACEAFRAIDIIDMSGVCKLAAYENMFTTFESKQ